MSPAKTLQAKGGPATAGVRDGFGKAKPQEPAKQLSSVVMPVWSSTSPSVVKLTKDYPDRTMVYDGKKTYQLVRGLYTSKPHPKPTEAEVAQFHADIRKDAKTDGNIASFMLKHPLPVLS